jgi:hypothetical protein
VREGVSEVFVSFITGGAPLVGLLLNETPELLSTEIFNLSLSVILIKTENGRKSDNFWIKNSKIFTFLKIIGSVSYQLVNIF